MLSSTGVTKFDCDKSLQLSTNLKERLAEKLPEDRKDILLDLPYRLKVATQIERLYCLLTNFEFMEAKISDCEPQPLIEDYDLALLPGVEISTEMADELRQYRDFIRKHVQRLTRYKPQELLFTLIHREGFSAARAKANDLISRDLWKKPWLRTTPAWIPPTGEVSTMNETVEILRHWVFDASCASDLAKDPQLVFFVKKLGQIGILDLERVYELSQPVSIDNQLRPLAVFCSANAQYLVIAYENGEADLLELNYHQDCISVSSTKKFEYLVPEYEVPIMEFDGDFLWHQATTGSMARLHLASGKVLLMSFNLPSDTNRGELNLFRLLQDVLFKSLKWFLQTSNPNAVEVNAIYPNELSGVTLIADYYMITLRCGDDTYLVVLEGDVPISSLRYARADVVGLCACGPHRVAVAFTNYSLVVFDTSRNIVQLYKTVLDELPTCMVWAGDELIWISERGTLHTWKVGVSNKPRDIMGDGGIFLMAKRLITRPDGTLVVITVTGVLSFSILHGEFNQSHQLRAVFDAGSKGTYYAIQERGNEIWLLRLLNGVFKDDVRIDTQPYSFCRFGVDGTHHLLVAQVTGQGVLINLESHNVNSVVQIPSGITSVAGDPEGGFWLTDGAGAIYFVGLDRICQKVGQVDLDVVGMSQLQCWPGLVIWSGVGLHHTELGEDTVPVLVFFQPEDSRQRVLRQIGQRFFTVADGRFQTLAYDTKRNRLLIIWQKGSPIRNSLKFGTLHDFINKHEDEQSIIGIDLDICAAQITVDSSGLYLLCVSGNLFRLDAQTLRVQAVLSGSIPLTGMTKGPIRDRALALIEGSSRLIFCEFEKSSST